MKIFACIMLTVVVAVVSSVSSFAQKEIGVSHYPNATEMPDATKRLMETKAPTWIAATVYRTDDSINDVVKHFREQAEKNERPTVISPFAKRLLDDNWRIVQRPVSGANVVFGASKELREGSKKQAKDSYGTILLDDSFVRVHLISPYPASATGVDVVEGTMIVLIRERMPTATEVSASADADEPVYTGRDVTRRVRILSKPEPAFPGGKGTVVLRAVFGSAGKVTKLQVVSGPTELAEEAMKAARKITFEPAIKDGRYVAMWLQLEYHFY